LTAHAQSLHRHPIKQKRVQRIHVTKFTHVNI
jgi:hypothetical protein